MFRVTIKFYSISNIKQKTECVFLFVMMLIGGVVESCSISLMLPLVSTVIDSNNWRESWYAVIICKFFNIDSQIDFVKMLIVLLISIFIIKNIYLAAEYYLQNRFIAKNRVELQIKLLREYMHMPYSFFLHSSTGELLRIIQGDTNQAFSLLNSVISFYTELIVGIAIGIAIIIISPQISMCLVIVLLLELLIISRVLKPYKKRSGDEQRLESAYANKWLLQSLNGIKSIKVSSKEDFFAERYAKHAGQMANIEMKVQTIDNLPRLLIESCTISGVLTIVLIMICRGTELNSLIPQLSAFAVAAVRLLPSVNRISSAINQVPFLEGGLDNVIDTLKNSSYREDYLKSKGQGSELSFTKDIFINNISFQYDKDTKKIFDGASLRIKYGESVGVIGASGGGKTTLVDLILSLLEPQNGNIEVDGLNIKDNASNWLRHVAYIPQQIFLIDDTIAANVCLGIGSNDVDEKRVYDVLSEAQLLDFVEELPQGIYTEVGEAGIRLSGGQRQRIGIARALYSNPDVLVFDEATSALDNETEASIMKSIDGLRGKRTLIIVAHRLTTIQGCDAIYRVEKGKIVCVDNK